ncbi:MAG TPA: hypothetical protein VH234_02580 [Candidatus Saccharimonadales bacterium]|nr:hypothetical protein [Candidatus Saccharimonadales bacterium]
MKEVAWIFGNSASGKETFVKKITEGGEYEGVLQSLDWVGKTIMAAQSSLAFIGQYDGDPVTEHREGILTEVPCILRHADVALVKWQGVDSGTLRVERLRAALPDARHRIIQLVTPDEELAERLPLKDWWNENDDIPEFIAEEHTHIDNCIAALKGYFPITRLSGSTIADYAILRSYT